MIIEQGDAGTGAASETSTTPEAGGSTGTGGAAAPSATGGTGTPPASTNAAGAGVPPVYSPNFKFKYAAAGETNKQVEAEFDDFLKPVVKDAETEEKLRKLYARSHGLDFVQAERDRLKQEYQPLAEKYQTITGSLQRLSGFVEKGDYRSFFESLKIPEEQILRYALERVQYHKMDPQQRAQLDAQRQQQDRASALEQQNQLLTQNFQQLAAQQRDFELSSALQRADVAKTVETFDARAGKPGAFKNLVIQRGQYYALAQGVDMPPDQVVADVLAMIGAQPAAGQQAPANGAGGGGTTPQKPPVLPNVSGRGTSPAKQILRSTDDLRKRAAELAASE